jgi:predicted lipoprotein with Yx(FWY)xxD motif
MVRKFTVSALGVAALLIAGSAIAADPAKTSNGALVGDKGMTLYTYDKDAPNSGKSVCNDKCATNWPPLKASASAKADGAWTVVTRDDGTKQWAYKGQPLYYWVKDKAAGDKTGDGVGGVWHTATP